MRCSLGMPAVTARRFLVVTVTSMGCQAGEAATRPLISPRFIALSVTFSDPVLVVGSQATATVRAEDQTGGSKVARTATWEVVDGPDVVAVDSTGVVTARSPGRAILRARVDSLTRDVSVVVHGSDAVQRSTQRAALPLDTLDFPYPALVGRSIAVAAGGNLQRALDAAQRGDEVVLAAGATFTGNFVLPAKAGTAANGWIVVRSSGSASLPAPGGRVVAEHAVHMARIVTPNTAPALATKPGASGWRLVGLEVTAHPDVTERQFGLLTLGEGGAPQSSLELVPTDLVLDRVYVHGQPNTSTSRCVGLNSSRTEISGSLLDECHGRGFDSQAIWGGNGPGPYRIVNNTLRGAGENIMFGGSDPAIPGLVPSDIEIRGNYIHTPLAWKGRWTKKNLVEFKNARRVLMEGNVLDGSWSDAQTGWAVVIKSANQSGRCAWCRSTDITFARNLIRNAGAGINIGPKDDNPNTDTTARRVVISESLLDGIGVPPFDGDRRGFQVLGGVSDIVIERTVLTGNLQAAMMLDPANGGASRATFRENVWARGAYGVIATGRSPGTPSLQAAPGAVWQRMFLVGPPEGAYPAGTAFVSRESHSILSTDIRAKVRGAVERAVPADSSRGR